MKRKLQIVASFLVGAALIWWLFRGIDTQKVSEAVREAKWGWLLASQVPLFASFFTRIFRWRYIVHATSKASFRGMLSATQIGFLANFTLPMRVGEFIRAIVLARLEKIPFSKGIALCGLDRVTDIFGLMVVMGVAIAAFPVGQAVTIPKGTVVGMESDFLLDPAFITTGSIGIGISLVVLLATLVMLYVNQERVFRIHNFIVKLVARGAGMISERLTRVIEALGAKTGGMLHEFSGGLHVFRSPGDMTKSLAWSMVTWALFMTATFCFIEAFGINAPWYGVFVVQTMVALSTGIGVAPGFIGQFHAGVILGVLLAAPGVDLSTVQAMAIVVHLLNLLPVVVLGVICLVLERDRLSGAHLLKEVEELKASQSV
jgi:uncharacterized protein (TIRG00374 family)